MTKVCDILETVESLAPPSLAMDWDNVGLLCGSRQGVVTKVLVALDPFQGVCQEAADWGAELILTHHPLIFHPLKSLTGEDGISRSIAILMGHGISAINAHTNLDCASQGVNDQLAAVLGLTDITPIPGQPWPLLRQGTVPPQPLGDFLAHVKTRLQAQGLRYVDAGRPVHVVAVGGGSCADEMEQALAAGCDTFVTADVKYNQFWQAQELGLNLIDAGHFATENPVVGYLAQKIQEAFPEIQVKISKTHRDCMKFY